MSADFIDSNVFVYLFDETDSRKRERADTLVTTALDDDTAAISFQVVQEVLNVLTRKIPVLMTVDGARRVLDDVLTPLYRVPPSPALYHRAFDVQSRYQFSFYDSLIVAAALHAGCSRLYSEDLHHGQRIEGLVIENPFRA